jgi:hypothetical protein
VSVTKPEHSAEHNAARAARDVRDVRDARILTRAGEGGRRACALAAGTSPSSLKFPRRRRA